MENAIFTYKTFMDYSFVTPKTFTNISRFCGYICESFSAKFGAVVKFVWYVLKNLVSVCSTVPTTGKQSHSSPCEPEKVITPPIKDSSTSGVLAAQGTSCP